jgi:hypothetical protein
MATEQVMVKLILDRWNALIKNFDTLLSSLSDEQLMREITPGKNRGIYLLGHLIAVHDDMLPILNFGEKQFPHFYEPFLKSPDKTVSEIPSVRYLRQIWSKQSGELTQKFNGLAPDEWFKKHNSVSAEDFANEPHRNKLNVLVTRTTHLAYHAGQLTLLK